jgi:hypothetical protein
MGEFGEIVLSAEAARTVGHPWRVVEVTGVGLASVAVGAVAFGVRIPMVVDVLGRIDPAPVEGFLVFLVAGAWVALLLVLAATRRGRRYVAKDASDVLVAENVETRMDSLTIAGLVFAGLALGPAAVGQASTYLTVGFAAFMVAWAAAFFPERMSSTLVRDAMHWIGLACLLGGVHVIATGFAGAPEAARVAAMAGTVGVGIYALVHVSAHYRGAFSGR